MIEIQYNDLGVLDTLQKLSRRMDDMTPVMRGIAGVITAATAACLLTTKIFELHLRVVFRRFFRAFVAGNARRTYAISIG